jgi:hypothetical protein
MSLASSKHTFTPSRWQSLHERTEREEKRREARRCEGKRQDNRIRGEGKRTTVYEEVVIQNWKQMQ